MSEESKKSVLPGSTSSISGRHGDDTVPALLITYVSSGLVHGGADISTGASTAINARKLAGDLAVTSFRRQ